MCAGLPVREADYSASPTLSALLTLPASQTPVQKSLDEARRAWSAALGGAPVVLLGSVARARKLLLRALGVCSGEPVGLPANATRDLAEAIKHHPATPRWLDLGTELVPLASAERLADVRVAWAEPCGGAWASAAPNGVALVVDASDSLHSLGPPGSAGAATILFGLHLDADPRRAGALVVCHDPALALALEALARPDDRPDATLALAQLHRLAGPAGLAARQRVALAAVWQGLEQAAGLPLLAPAPGVMAQHIALRVPEACDAATFYAYMLGERTPVHWLPALRPLHYAAQRPEGAPAAAATGCALARVLLVPVGPDMREEEVVHAVLGITKAADYLGVRWTTDPARAVWYADLMTEWYGADHDAFRPLGHPDTRVTGIPLRS